MSKPSEISKRMDECNDVFLDRMAKEIGDAESRGFQRAIELLRSADTKPAIGEYNDGPEWADWLEKRGRDGF